MIKPRRLHLHVLKLHSSLDTNRQLALTTVGYKGRDHDTKTLSYSTVRDLQRLGHLGLGKKAYWELARILRRDGVVFPAGGVKAVWDESGSSSEKYLLQSCSI